jgi:predicted AlkP superfamily phosphohydrolase/phosphomutase
MHKKVIVIGLDGLEPAIVERLLQQNELPNLQRIRNSGYYGRVRTTYPAQTPVAWSSFVTGTNPGGHGIFDFISRDPNTYMPDIALNRFERPKSVLALPKVVNRRQGVPVWQHLSKAGVPSVVLRCPVTFPAENLLGKMISGVGVPDIRGSQGTGTFYTQDRTLQPKEHEEIVFLNSDKGEITTHVVGPRNPKTNPISDITSEIKVKVDRGARKLTILSAGNNPVDVAENGWSPLIRLKFKLSMLQSVTGVVRFYCRSLDPHVEFYASPVNFDPAAPLFPISYPLDYGKTLSESIGLFSTLGMAEDHTGHNNGRFDEMAYKAQCDLIFKEREAMLMHELNKFKEGFLFTVFDTPDRLQHMFWKFIDPSHPYFDREQAANLGPQVDEIYRQCDALVGRVLKKVDEDTLLIVLSDHGFNTFRRSFDTNSWLWQNQLLALKDGKKPNDALTDSSAVDWSKTYAYSMGLGGIYLNLKGRERGGIVDQGSGEADRVRNAIQTGMAGCPDPETGGTAVRSVARREELYNGAYVSESPDLLVNFCPGYRVSWQSSLGGFANQILENNDRRWSGDHIIDPDAVPGILFLNRPVTHNHANIIDLAPTILKSLNVPIPQSVEGKSLL